MVTQDLKGSMMCALSCSAYGISLDANEQYAYLQNFFFSEAFTATWSKYYCTYKKQLKQFSMLQYNQISGKTVTLLFFKKIILLTKLLIFGNVQNTIFYT